MPKNPASSGFKRSYLYKVDARCNAAKLAALEAAHQEWQRLLPVVGQHLWQRFLSGSERSKSLSSAVGADSVFGATPLVTSVKQCMAVAIEGLIKSWKSNLANRIARQVMRSERWAGNDPHRHQLQGAGETKLRECRRYRSFIQRFRGWLTSQVKGAVNRALERFKPGTVVMEDLGFHAQAGELSARMNRLVRRMGTGIFKQALEQKSEAQGFKLETVNPAHTSQECRSCGFISRDSRRGNHYRCVCCNRQGHADALASANLVERFRQGRSALNSKHTALGVQGLQRWAQRMLRLLEQATPGTSRHQGALGCARAGLVHLQKKNSGALRRCEPLQLKALLDRISAEGRSTQLNGLSTRYSG